jgi:hypothetical protein
VENISFRAVIFLVVTPFAFVGYQRFTGTSNLHTKDFQSTLNFNSEDWSDIFVRNVGDHLDDYRTSQLRMSHRRHAVKRKVCLWRFQRFDSAGCVPHWPLTKRFTLFRFAITQAGGSQTFQHFPRHNTEYSGILYGVCIVSKSFHSLSLICKIVGSLHCVRSLQEELLGHWNNGRASDCSRECGLSAPLNNTTSTHDVTAFRQYYQLIYLFFNLNVWSHCQSCLRHGYWPFGYRDHGFKSRSSHGCLSSSFCVVLYCVDTGLASSWSPAQGVIPNVKLIHNFRNNSEFVRAIAQVVSRRPFTAEARVRALVSPCGVYGGKNGTGTCFSSSRSVFPCQYHSTVALHTHIIWGMLKRPVGGRSSEP